MCSSHESHLQTYQSLYVSSYLVSHISVLLHLYASSNFFVFNLISS